MSGLTLGYEKSPLGNVGDDLNPWLMERLLPDVRFEDSNRVLLCIGSILVADRWDGYDYKLVLGSGAKAPERLPRRDESWDYRFVRGPKTATALGDVTPISDPALLLARYVRPAARRKGVGIVPYYRSSHRFWQVTAQRCGARLISPRMELEAFIEALNGCEMVLCEAMHGAIFADALRIRWRPISFQNARLEGVTHRFKWSDWTESVELDFDPVVQPLDRMPHWPIRGVLPKLRAVGDLLHVSGDLAGRLRQAIRDDAFVLSRDEVFEDRVERLASVFREINSEFGR